ncbi:MAG: 1-(5-phosphoribosyl)-5-[(5-phosphoribosylamino)methylideneamino]imidazole-4-carboxamide isomerase [Neisseriaceae bacterium]|nr:1-(5-phosphoribosyl)-5-[(5-phosphoribosylamino)methylideneamino]imidazole-4-carboxamide isomerase [Neisseriaceae bacterium]
MLLIPAIDLKNGQCVRLKQGLMNETTVFSDNPQQMAQHWLSQGARRLHLVDLDGAFAGKPQNFAAIETILSAVGQHIPVELGGGIRDIQTIEKYIKIGLRYVIIGTAAVKNPEFLRQACREFPQNIIVGIDAKYGQVATDGWAEVSSISAIDLGKQFEDAGVQSIIYTDIARDGMMSGVNVEATQKLANALSVPVIASGGLTNLDDIRALCAVADSGIEGAITGRAIYEGAIDFQAAQRLADELTA